MKYPEEINAPSASLLDQRKTLSILKDNFCKFWNCNHSRAWHGHDPWSVPHMYAAALGISPKTKIHNYSSPTRSPKLTERKSFTFKFRLLTLSISMTMKILQLMLEK